MAENLEFLIQLRDQLTAPAQKMAETLNHIAISSRAGAVSLDKLEQKMKSTARASDGLGKSLRVLLTVDLVSLASGIFNTLVNAGKSFYGFIKDAFNIIGDSEDIHNTFKRLLGSDKLADEYQDYANYVAGRFSSISSNAAQKIGAKLITGGFRGENFKQALDAALAVERTQHGGAETVNAVADLENKLRVQGLRRPNELTTVAGINVNAHPKELSQLEALTKQLHDAGKNGKDLEKIGDNIVHIFENMITNGKDFADVLDPDKFSFNEITTKFQQLGDFLLQDVRKTDEWKAFVAQLNTSFKAVGPGSVIFEKLTKVITVLTGEITKLLATGLKKLTEWLEKPANIQWLEDLPTLIKEKFGELNTWLEDNVWSKIDNNSSIIDNIGVLADKIGVIIGKGIFNGLKDGLYSFFTNFFHAGAYAFLRTQFGDDVANEFEKFDTERKAKNEREEADRKKKNIEDMVNSVGPQPSNAEKITTQSFEPSAVKAYQYRAPVKVVITDWTVPSAVSPFNDSGSKTSGSGDVINNHTFNFGDFNNAFDPRAYPDLPLGQRMDKQLDDFINNNANDIKKMMERSLKNIRNPKDQGR